MARKFFRNIIILSSELLYRSRETLNIHLNIYLKDIYCNIAPFPSLHKRPIIDEGVAKLFCIIHRQILFSNNQPLARIDSRLDDIPPARTSGRQCQTQSCENHFLSQPRDLPVNIMNCRLINSIIRRNIEITFNF